MSQNTTGELTPEVEQQIRKIIEEHKNQQGALIPILHEIQEFYGYIPYEIQVIIANELNMPLADIYGVITFYSRFSLKPVGKYKIGVCLGTACYVRGSDKVLEKVEKKLNLKAGETSADGLYTIEATRCIGACGLAPVMTINEDVYGRLNLDEIEDIVSKYK